MMTALRRRRPPRTRIHTSIPPPGSRIRAPHGLKRAGPSFHTFLHTYFNTPEGAFEAKNLPMWGCGG
eukprot:3043359-Prymnesium_polylepis.1